MRTSKQSRQPASSVASSIPAMLASQVSKKPISNLPAGNRVLAKLFRSARSAAPVPTNLRISSPNDPAELEADRVAAEVMQMPTQSPRPVVQRKCSDCEEEDKVQRVATGESPDNAPAVIHQVTNQPGQPLPDSTRNFFEPRLGADLSSVRIHTDAQAARSADAVEANAYTLGDSIAFADGQYSPQSEGGKTLLAHELVHVAKNQIGPQSSPDGPSTSATGRLWRTPSSIAPQTSGNKTSAGCELAQTNPNTSGQSVEVQFARDSAEISQANRVRLQQFVEAWNQAGGTANVEVHAYASTDGASDYNLNLSCQRAQSVVGQLAAAVLPEFIPASKIRLYAHGETSEFGAGLGENRRVLVVTGASPAPRPAPAPAPDPVPPSETCDPKVVDVTKIPGIMDANGMPTGASVMREWFAGPAGTAQPDTTTVKMEWVLKHARAKAVFDDIIQNKRYRSPAAQSAIMQLIKTIGLEGGGEFDFNLPVTDLYPKYDIQFATVGENSDPMDDLKATLGRFTFEVVVAGRFDPFPGTGGGRVTLRDVGVYVRDSFDFDGPQFLGCWNACTNEISDVFCGGFWATNGDFRDWRTANGRGGDFLIFSDVKSETLAAPESFDDQPDEP